MAKHSPDSQVPDDDSSAINAAPGLDAPADDDLATCAPQGHEPAPSAAPTAATVDTGMEPASVSESSDVTAEATAVPEPTDGHPPLQEVLDRLTQFEELMDVRLTTLHNAAERLRADRDERDEQRRNREALHGKLQASKGTFRFQLLQPLIQRLAGLHDLICDFSAAPPDDVNVWQDALTILRSHVEQTLETHGIERICPKEGDSFDSRWHHIVDTATTSDPDSDGTICQLTQSGYLFFGQNDRNGDLRATVVRPARVILWKHKPPDQIVTEEDTAANTPDIPAGDSEDEPERDE